MAEPLYNPSSVPFGIPAATASPGPSTPALPGKWQFRSPVDGSAVGDPVILEGSWNCDREAIMIDRPGIYGQGADLVVPEDPDNEGRPAELTNTASNTFQIPISTQVMPYGGCYIEGCFDAGRGAERWVLQKITSQQPNNSYWTCAGTFKRDASI